jgi:hypothetical protein
MKGQYQTPPTKSLDALTEAANNLRPSHSGMAQLLNHIHDFPEDHNPHPMYVVGLKDMATSGGLRRAIVIGWRYLSVSGSEKKFAAEVHHDSDGSNHRFAGLNHGPAVEALIRVIEDDKIREQVESDAFSLSTGAIPALDISAVWLRATNNGNDMLFVVPPAPSFLKPWPDTYTVQQFENAVQDEAAKNVKIHATVFA